MPLGISAAMFRASPETRSQKCTRMYTFGVDVLYSVKKLLEIDGTDTLPANVPPCTFAGGEFLLCKNVAVAWNHRHPWRY